MKSIRNKSAYAAKQGRARKTAGDSHDGPRTRYAPTSPISSEYVTNPGHRLALYFARGEQLERERQKRAAYREYNDFPWSDRKRSWVPRVALP